MLHAVVSRAAAADNMRRGIAALSRGLFSASKTRPVRCFLPAGNGAMARQMSSGGGEPRLQGYQHNVFLTLGKNLQNVPARVLATVSSALHTIHCLWLCGLECHWALQWRLCVVWD
jgi:hypothetical protein